MIPRSRTCCTLAVATLLAVAARAQDPREYPTAEQVEELLRAEPFSAATWPAWRLRLAAWFHDPTPAPDAAYWAAKHYFRAQSGGVLALPERYRDDYLAWYFLSGSYLHAKAASPAELAIAAAACRRCLALEPSFARGHRNLAMALIAEAETQQPAAGRLDEAAQELATARALDPLLSVAEQEGAIVRLRTRQFSPAQALGGVLAVAAVVAFIVVAVVVTRVRGQRPAPP